MGLVGLVTQGGVRGEEASCRHAKRSVNARVQAFAYNDPFALRLQPKSVQENSLPHAETGKVQPPRPIPRHGYCMMRLALQGPCPHPCSASRLDLQRQLQQGFYGVQQNLALPWE